MNRLQAIYVTLPETNMEVKNDPGDLTRTPAGKPLPQASSDHLGKS